MGAYKQISPQDTFLTTYVSHKEWIITGSEYSNYGVQYTEISKYEDDKYYLDENDSFSSSYLPLYFKSLDLLYYRSFNNLDNEFSELGIVSSSYEHYIQTSLIQSNVRHIEDEILLISIPREIIGSGIKPGSFTMGFPTIDEETLYVRTGYVLSGYILELLDGFDLEVGVLYDSTEGSIIAKTSLGDYIRVGDINYFHGIITITHPDFIDSYSDDLDKPRLTFKSTKEIHTLNTHCTVLAEELNYSSNPTTIISGSAGNIKSQFLEDEFNPYITTVGLYNDANELVAVGKLSQPTPKSDQTDMVFVVKTGFDGYYNP
jgi:hypothetical protein